MKYIVAVYADTGSREDFYPLSQIVVEVPEEAINEDPNFIVKLEQKYRDSICVSVKDRVDNGEDDYDDDDTERDAYYYFYDSDDYFVRIYPVHENILNHDDLEATTVLFERLKEASVE